MDSCSHHRLDILRYLDHHLSDQEQQAFLAHLRSCNTCKVRMEEEQVLSRLLANSRPLYVAPLTLHVRVSAVIHRRSGKYRTWQRLYTSVLSTARHLWPGMSQLAPGWRLVLPVMPVVPVIALVLLLLSNSIDQVSAASYVAAAVAVHRNYLKGNLPPQIQSSSPEVVNAWLSSKLPFPFRLPSAQPGLPREQTYQLIGARLVSYHNNYAALISYQTARKEAISLLITSNKLASVTGGVEVRTGPLTFHYRAHNGFEVITWVNRGLTYALVSDVSGSAQESCLVCHENMADHQNYEARR